MSEPYPHRWINQKILVVHAGGEAVGDLLEVNDIVAPANRTAHILLKADDGDGRILYLPIHGISYISTYIPPVSLSRNRR